MRPRLIERLPTTVGNVLRALPEMPYVLVTSLDSDDQNFPYLSGLAADRVWSLEGRAVLTGRAATILAGAPGVFTHFDEVWLFRRFPVRLPGDSLSLTDPLSLSEEDLTEAGHYMASESAVAAFGDGNGLNALIARDKGLRFDVTNGLLFAD